MISKWRVILLSLIVGTIYVLPHILFAIEMKGNYKIFFAAEEDENEVFLARIREVYDGHYYISDPYIYENKSKPYTRSYLSELVLGILGRVFRLSIFQLLILVNFILPIITFLLIFYFLFVLTKSQNLSLFGSTFILLTPFPETIYFLIKGLDIGAIFPIWGLTFHFIIYISCLIFTYKALNNIKISYIFFGAIFFGLLFYSHPFFWAHTVVSYYLFCLYLIFKKRFIQLKALILIILGGLVISIPYWINFIKSVNLPYFSEVAMRYGFYPSRQPLLWKTPIIGILLFLFFYKNRDFNFYFISSFLIGGFLCLNQQVISGIELGPGGWYHYTLKQITIMAGMVLLNNFLMRRGNFWQRILKGFDYKRFKKPILVFSFGLLILSGLSIQLTYYESVKTEQKERQFLYDAFLWLDNNTEVDSVILASDSVSLILPIYTHNNVYIGKFICDSLVKDAEIMDRFLIFARIYKMNKDEINQYIINHKATFFGGSPGDPKYKNIEDFFRLNMVFENVSRKYKTFEKEDIIALLKKFRVDYIFYSPYEKKIPQIDFNEYPFLHKVYDKGGVQIYSIKY